MNEYMNFGELKNGEKFTYVLIGIGEELFIKETKHFGKLVNRHENKIDISYWFN
jgi:hypothetical protein